MSTPLLIKWNYQNEGYAINTIRKVDWKVRPMAEVNATVKDCKRMHYHH